MPKLGLARFGVGEHCIDCEPLFEREAQCAFETLCVRDRITAHGLTEDIERMLDRDRGELRTGGRETTCRSRAT